MDYIKEVFQYGGTVIMAGLFVWVFIQDKTKNNKLLEAISMGNENIAKSLEIISKNQAKSDEKIDRNYQEILRKK